MRARCGPVAVADERSHIRVASPGNRPAYKRPAILSKAEGLRLGEQTTEAGRSPLSALCLTASPPCPAASARRRAATGPGPPNPPAPHFGSSSPLSDATAHEQDIKLLRQRLETAPLLSVSRNLAGQKRTPRAVGEPPTERCWSLARAPPARPDCCRSRARPARGVGAVGQRGGPGGGTRRAFGGCVPRPLEEVVGTAGRVPGSGQPPLLRHIVCTV